MDQNERNLIDGLFAKLDQAERQSGPRDAEAQRYIVESIARQPAAPYYMAQAVLVQENALKTLNERVQDLERQLAERPASGGGGFLSGLFGGGAQSGGVAAAQGPAMAAEAGLSSGRGWQNPPPSERIPAMPPGANFGAPPASAAPVWGAQPQAQGHGFLASAIQTAAGVAGGVLLADAVSSLFGGSAAHAAGFPAAGLEAATLQAQTAAAQAEAAAAEAQAAAADTRDWDRDPPPDDYLDTDDFGSQDDLMADNGDDFDTFGGF
jgi:hypothetical protein